MIRRSLIAALAAAALLVSAAAAGSPTCAGDSRLLSWPTGSPLWELCWVRPASSSGPSGSGLEIHDVYYRGRLVLKRGHVPILNVDYDPNGCGCFRDWLYSEKTYRTENELAPGYFEPPYPPETVCDHAIWPDTPPGDCPWGGPGPCQDGVSAEHEADSVTLTTETSAGWYRYAMRWTFHRDGTIEPTFGFGTYNTSCSGATHRHHAYWRLDFDVDGADGDTASQDGIPFALEATSTWGDGTVRWQVRDDASGLGYEIIPGAQDLLLAADDFSHLDFMVSLFHPGQYSDTGFSCDINAASIADGEPVAGSDLVVWYRGGVEDRVGEDILLCKTAGPILAPLGDWAGGTIFGDGFESGDMSAWSSSAGGR